MTQPTFTGEMTIIALDALTVMVKLEQLPPKETRAYYIRLISNMEPRAFDQCMDCMIRSYGLRVDVDGRAAILDAIARGRTLVISFEPYLPDQHCKRCTDHLNFVNFTNRLLGDE